MTYLLLQIFGCLLVALLIGVVATWYYQRANAQHREELIQQDYKSRLRQIELDRERTVKNLSGEIDRLKKKPKDQSDSAPPDASTIEYENRIARLEEHVIERETAIGEHREEIQSLRSALTAEKNRSVESETALLLEYEEKLNTLAAKLSEQTENNGFEEREAAMRTQHAQAIQALEAQLTPQALDAVFSEREQALRRKHQAELAQLQGKLNLPGNNAAADQSESVLKLQSEIKLRDDSIAVLRDDLAELRQEQSLPGRGRQDEFLRATMAEALEWQEKYEATATELKTLQAKKPASGTTGGVEETLPQAPQDHELMSQERSGLDRIVSLVSGAGQPKDNLQDIKGIGPVLEKTLNEHGVYRFQQIAEFEAKDIAELATRIGRFSNRIQRDDWVGQAMALQHKPDS